MTLHQLLNTCNADPDIRITVFTYPECEYDGKYEDIDSSFFGRKVNSFAVEKLNDRGYRTDIAHMKIYLAKN